MGITILLLDCSATLLLDFGVTLDEDSFTSSLLLDLASEEEDFTTLLLESSFLAEEEDCLSSLEEGFAEELDSFAFSTDEDDSSLGSVAGAELFESSPQATNKTAESINAKIFIFQI